MVTEAKIKAEYIQTHKELEKQYYKYGLISLAEFNQLHGQNWNDMEAELITEGYLKPPEPVRDAFAEITVLQQKIAELEKKVGME
ncbi:MAG TPA: hypothetical protein VMW45_03660 [Dehalococcoidia bacterium]|nr:hypothetical protein [Dehalococcoidia bacterium]